MLFGLIFFSFNNLWAGLPPYLICNLKNKYGKNVSVDLSGDYRTPSIVVIGVETNAFYLQYDRKIIESGRNVNFVLSNYGNFVYSFQMDPRSLQARFRDLTNRQVGYETLEARYFYNGTCAYQNIRNPNPIISELLTTN